MALSSAEEESIESLKRWWRESGRLLLAGVVAVVVVYAGWQFFQGSQSRTAQQASSLYDQITQFVVLPPGEEPAESDRQQARQLIDRLKADHSSSTYALYGALFGARLAVEDGNLTQARQELEWLLDHTRSGFFGETEPTLVRIAQLRLAEVLLASGDTGSALTLISSADQGSLRAEFEQLRGDIYMAQGQRDQALAAYEAAMLAGDDSPVLQMKVTELQGSR